MSVASLQPVKRAQVTEQKTRGWLCARAYRVNETPQRRQIHVDMPPCHEGLSGPE